MKGQMCWLALVGSNGDSVLHLRLSANQSWQPYTAFTNYFVPDHNIPGGSKGWATYQKLIQSGWTLVNSSQGKHFSAVYQITEKPGVGSRA